MPEMIESDVLIVGAGPVGLTLAIDLAWRGVDVTVVETRARAAAGADSDPVPPRPVHQDGWAGLQLADAGAAAPHQPDISRTDPVRARRGAAAQPHCQPDVGRRRGGAGYVGGCVLARP